MRHKPNPKDRSELSKLHEAIERLGQRLGQRHGHGHGHGKIKFPGIAIESALHRCNETITSRFSGAFDRLRGQQ